MPEGLGFRLLVGAYILFSAGFGRGFNRVQ